MRRLTSGPGQDRAAAWSPDGTRIGFARIHHDKDPNEICWVTVDGARGRCRTLPGMAVVNVLGWLDPRNLLASAMDSTGTQRLVRANVDTPGAVTIADGVAAYLTADGELLACLCLSPNGRNSWQLLATDRPDKRRRITAPANAVALLFVDPSARSARYVQSVSIGSPADSEVPIDGSARLTAIGLSGTGEPLDLPVLTWSVDDSSVATIDSGGVLHPNQLGTVSVTASAGGWRRSMIRLRVTRAAAMPVLSERWDTTFLDRWSVFGVPTPVLAVGPQGVDAFWHHGDSTYPSGAYSRFPVSGQAGFGLDAELSTPINALQWQSVSFELSILGDSVSLASWDHRTGPPPFRTLPLSVVQIPGGEGVFSRRFLLVTAGAEQQFIPVDSTAIAGRWWRLRIQVFSDGRVGIAIGG